MCFWTHDSLDMNAQIFKIRILAWNARKSRHRVFWTHKERTKIFERKKVWNISTIRLGRFGHRQVLFGTVWTFGPSVWDLNLEILAAILGPFCFTSSSCTFLIETNLWREKFFNQQNHGTAFCQLFWNILDVADTVYWPDTLLATEQRGCRNSSENMNLRFQLLGSTLSDTSGQDQVTTDVCVHTADEDGDDGTGHYYMVEWGDGVTSSSDMSRDHGNRIVEVFTKEMIYRVYDIRRKCASDSLKIFKRYSKD